MSKIALTSCPVCRKPAHSTLPFCCKSPKREPIPPTPPSPDVIADEAVTGQAAGAGGFRYADASFGELVGGRTWV